MTQVVTIQVPQFAVRTTIREALNAFHRIAANDPNTYRQVPGAAPRSPLVDRVWRATLNAGINGSLETVVDILCDSEQEANEFAALIGGLGWEATVPSFTEFGVTYMVRGTNDRANWCSCPSFDPTKGNNPNCKHIQAVNRSPQRFTRRNR